MSDMPAVSHHPRPGEDPVTLETLPPADTHHWVARRKAQVVKAVQSGLLTLDEAMDRYRLSMEEFIGWQRALYRYGVSGLQVGEGHLRNLQGRIRRPRKGKKRAAGAARQAGVARAH
jgi:hypothetical protein